MSYDLADGKYHFSSRAFDAFFKGKPKQTTSLMLQIKNELHVSITSIKEWRRGAHEPSDIDKVNDLADFFKVNPKDLLVKENAMSDTSETYKLNDLQLMSLYRVQAAILDFFDLAVRSDHFVWKDTDLRGFPPYLVSNFVPSCLYLSTVENPSNLIYGENGILSDDLCAQAGELVLSIFAKERMFLENTPVYEPLSELIDNYINNYGWDDEGNWEPHPDLLFEAGAENTIAPMIVKEAAAMKALDEILEKYVKF